MNLRLQFVLVRILEVSNFQDEQRQEPLHERSEAVLRHDGLHVYQVLPLAVKELSAAQRHQQSQQMQKVVYEDSREHVRRL